MERKEKSVGINAVLNVIRTLLSIIFPLVTYPYVSRVLQVENLGKVNYSISIVSYFSLISALGIYTYAVRECSKRINDNDKLHSFVSEIFSLNLISMSIAYILMFIVLIFVKPLHNYTILILIQSLSILFTTIGVEWINVAFEDYFYITLRSFIIQLFSLVALFAFVRNRNDYYIYSIIMVSSNGLISLLNIFHVRKYCKIVITKSICFKNHLKPIFVLFSNNIAVSIYLNSDVTLLGWIVGDFYVGLYSVAVKIYGIIKQLIASFYSVILARMSMYYQKEKYEDFKSLLNNTLSTIILLSVPASFGLFLVAEDIIVIMFGAEYIEATPALKVLSIAIIFAIMGGALAYCVNIPLEREKNNLLATTVSAIVNILLNIFMIPFFKHVGAAFTTLIAELVVFLMLLWGLRDQLYFFMKKKLLLIFIKSVLSSLPMLAMYFLFRIMMHINGVLFLVLMILLSAFIYFIMNLLLKNEGLTYFIKNIKNKIK